MGPPVSSADEFGSRPWPRRFLRPRRGGAVRREHAAGQSLARHRQPLAARRLALSSLRHRPDGGSGLAALVRHRARRAAACGRSSVAHRHDFRRRHLRPGATDARPRRNPGGDSGAVAQSRELFRAGDRLAGLPRVCRFADRHRCGGGGRGRRGVVVERSCRLCLGQFVGRRRMLRMVDRRQSDAQDFRRRSSPADRDQGFGRGHGQRRLRVVDRRQFAAADGDRRRRRSPAPASSAFSAMA